MSGRSHDSGSISIAHPMRREGRRSYGAASPASLTLSKARVSRKLRHQRLMGNCKGLSPASFYKLKAKYGGMELSDAKRLKQLEYENAKLKRLLADTMLNNVVLKDLLGKS